ncbi:MAG: hypothetical protein NTX03_01825, partial [Bacteroidetes bacterium]|nr:hypothetical protein [Bacteroidota bacterium]
MKKFFKLLFTTTLFFLSSHSLFAQREEVLNPQSEEKRVTFMKAKVKIEQVTYRQAGKDTFYSISFVDERGLVQIFMTYNLKQYFDYDSNTRLIARFDSVYKNKKYISLEYAASYYREGGIYFINHPFGATSRFLFFPEKSQIQETFIDSNGKKSITNYYLDGLNRITQEVYLDSKNMRRKERKFTYTKDGKVEKETILEYENNGSQNQTITYFVYDTLQRVIKKDYLEIQNPTDPKIPTTSGNTHILKISTSYEYDKKGNLITEIGVEKKNSLLNYKIIRAYNSKGLITLEEHFDTKGKNIFSYL